jgi:hypothetical protein
MSDIYDIDSNPWFTKDRSESTSFRVNRSFENIDVLIKQLQQDEVSVRTFFGI